MTGDAKQATGERRQGRRQVLSALGGLPFAALLARRALPHETGTHAGAKAPILLGMTTALSGDAMDLGLQMKTGVETGIADINAAGGVRGRPLELIALDDAYEPRRAAPNMRELIDRHKVLAIVGNVGTPTAVAALPIALQSKRLFYAPFTGAGVLRKEPPDRYVINFRASYAEEAEAMIGAVIDAGVDPRDVAFFTQRDAYGDSGFKGGLDALTARGLADPWRVVHVRYERNTAIVERALAELLLAERTPKAVVMVGTYKPCARFIQLARDHGLRAIFLNVSFVGSTSLASDLGPGHDGVIVTQVVPHPLRSEAPIAKEFRAKLEARGAGPPTFTSFEGYVAARILGEAMKRFEGKLDEETIVDALEALGSFDVGLGAPLFLGPGQHQACHQVWPTILRGGEFVDFEWSGLRELLR